MQTGTGGTAIVLALILIAATVLIIGYFLFYWRPRNRR